MKNLNPIHVASLIACLLSLPSYAQSQPPAPGSSVLRIATFNIANGNSSWPYNPAWIATDMVASGAHIIGLQEVHRHWSSHTNCDDVPAKLKSYLGPTWSYYYVPALSLPPDLFACGWNGKNREYGIAIFYRNDLFPINYPNFEWIELPTGQTGSERRVAQMARFYYGSRTFYVFNTHFQHNSAGGDYSATRRQQAEALVGWSVNYPGRKFLVGDMNANSWNWELQPIANVYLDMIAAFHPADPGHIDHIWSTLSLGGMAAGDYDTGSSDHGLFWFDINADVMCTGSDACCQTTTCTAQGKNCGSMSDGCGGTVYCGTCATGQECRSNVCVSCQPIPDPCGVKECGSASDGCGKTINCGTCMEGTYCKAGYCY